MSRLKDGLLLLSALLIWAAAMAAAIRWFDVLSQAAEVIIVVLELILWFAITLGVVLAVLKLWEGRRRPPLASDCPRDEKRNLVST